jgi:hypothetical protein
MAGANAGELLNIVTAQNTGPVPEAERCTTKYVKGHQAVPPDLRDLPNPFILSQHMAELARGLDPDALPPLMEGRADGWLPDLAGASVGMPKKINAHEVRQRRHKEAFVPQYSVCLSRYDRSVRSGPCAVDR